MAHCDLMVFNKRSNKGHKYWFHILDEGARFTRGWACRKKNEVARCFKEYEAEVRQRFPLLSRPPHISAVRVLRSDGEGDLMSTEFTEYCKQAGIKQEPVTICNTWLWKYW